MNISEKLSSYCYSNSMQMENLHGSDAAYILFDKIYEVYCFLQHDDNNNLQLKP